MAFFRASIGGGGGGVQTATGTISASASAQTISLNFKPKKLYIYSTTAGVSAIYDEDVSTTKFLRAVTGSGSGAGVAWTNMTSTASYVIQSVTNTGFTYKGTASYSMKYVALDS